MNRTCNYQNGIMSCGDCLDGYIREGDTCQAKSCENFDPCDGLVPVGYENFYSIYKLSCNDTLLNNHLLCMSNNPENITNDLGLLICSKNNLNGFCQFLLNSNSTAYFWIDNQLDSEDRIIKSFKLSKGRDACICDSPYYPVCNCFSANNWDTTKNNLNIYGMYIKVSPSNYEEFKITYPNKKYLKLYTEDEHSFELITEPYMNETYYIAGEDRIVSNLNLKKIRFEISYKLILINFNGEEITFDPWASIAEQNPNPDDYLFELPDGIDMTSILYVKLVTRTSNESNGNGVYLCNNNDNCYNINNHITFNDNFNPEWSNCSKGKIYIPGDNICVSNSEFGNKLEHALYYLNDGWEAFLCKHENDDIKECKYQENSGWHGMGLIKKIIVQAKLNTDTFNEFYANKEYVITYDEPNFNGNHIIYSINGLQNNSILRVRSIETSSNNIRTYLNTNSIEPSYNIKNDRYLTNTDATSFIFDEKTIDNGSGSYYNTIMGFIVPNKVNKAKFGYKSIRLDIKTNNKFKTYDIENGGVEISHLNGKSCNSQYNTEVYECDNKTHRIHRKLCYGYNSDICEQGYSCQNNGNDWYCRKEIYCTQYTNINEQDETCPSGYICNTYHNHCESGCLSNAQCDYDQYCDLSNGENLYNQEYCNGDNCKKGICKDYPARHFYSSIKKDEQLIFPDACNSERNSNHLNYCEYDALSSNLKIKINEGWEAYYCPTDMMSGENPEIIRNECIYLDENTDTASSELELNNDWLNHYYQLGALFINPKNYDKFIQYYGHSEYLEKGKGLKGYIELFTKENFKGKREVIWQDDEDLSDNLITGDKIKSIKIVGNLNPEFINNSNNKITLDRNDYYSNKDILNKINILGKNIPYKPTFKAIRSNNTPTPEYAWGFFESSPYGENGVTREYFYPGVGDNEVIPDLIYENKKQAETLDGADLILQDSHGSWTTNTGANPNYTGSFGINFQDPLFGGSLGDSDLEWFLTGSCQSLGKSGTSDQEAIWGYRELFANGLHGIGGFYKDSFWDDGPFYNTGMRFWIGLIYDRLPIGKTWVFLMYSDDPERNAGFISPGSCSEYMHKDYWFGIKTGPKKDPSKKYLKEYGFCYYSHANGSRGYAFSDIIGNTATSNTQVTPRPEENWPVFNENDNNINEYIANIISDYENISIKANKKLNNLYYFTDNNNNIEIEINNNNFNPEIPEKKLDSSLIVDLYSKAYDIIEIIKEEHLLDDLFLGDIKLYYGLEQEFSYEGNRTKAMINEILFTFYFHSGTGYFLKSNSITLGFDPITQKTTTVKSSIRSLNKTKESINAKKILRDLQNFKEKDKLNNYKIKYVKQKNQHRPSILKYDLIKHTITPIKIY